MIAKAASSPSLSRTAGEGGERSEPGEGIATERPSPTARFATGSPSPVMRERVFRSDTLTVYAIE